jgi:hypothetical protein
MSVIGLSRIVDGAVDGIDRGMQRRDRNDQRDRQQVQNERQDMEFEQGQQDREYALTRQSINDGRADQDYKVKQEKAARFKGGNEALRSWLTNGTIDGINAFAKKYTPEGESYILAKKPDGTHTLTVAGPKGEQVVHPTKDEIGMAMQYLMTQDVSKALSDRQSAKSSQAEKKSDRAHDMAKMEK